MANLTELVIFDCDGVLVDSEVITMRAIIASCADLGLALEMAEAEQMFTGGHWAVVVAEIERRLGGRVPESFTPDFRARLVKALDDEVEPVAGIVETLERMTHPRCVASNGPHAKMEATLGRCGLLPYFEGRVFSAYDIDRFKPDPALFLHAAERCGADPERCVVVEDSMNGVRASEAAGMRTIAYVSKGDGETLRQAGATILRDMRKLVDLL